MHETPGLSSSTVAFTDATAHSVGSGLLRILSEFSMAADNCEHIEALDEARKDALTKIQAEMSGKASQFLESKFSDLSCMSRKGRINLNNSLDQWKEKYRRGLDANLKLIQHSRLLMVPDNLPQKIIQTALKNLHRIMQDATMDLATTQRRICENPDSWSVDPTVKVKVTKRLNSKS